MKYREVPKFNDDILRMLNTPYTEAHLLGLVSLVENCGDYDLAVAYTRKFLTHENDYMRGIAIECISHIARLWRQLPEDLIQIAIDSLNDESDWVQGKADFTIDDLEVFIRGFRRPK